MNKLPTIIKASWQAMIDCDGLFRVLK